MQYMKFRKSFSIGDRVTAYLDSGDDIGAAEITGELVAIEGRNGKIKTQWGTFTANLFNAKILIELDDVHIEHIENTIKEQQ